MSPFVFILVADVLYKILSNAMHSHVLEGLENFPNLDSVLNLHFAYDTLLFLKAEKSVLENVKWLLLAFENSSCLKINYSKSEMYPLNLFANEVNDLANVMGCQIASFPLTYLEVPINNKTLTDIDWQFLIDNIEKRLQGWKSNLLSLGGRVTLLNVVISAIPFYWLYVYRMPAKIIYKFRRKFLWHGGNSTRRRYSLWLGMLFALVKTRVD